MLGKGLPQYFRKYCVVKQRAFQETMQVIKWETLALFFYLSFKQMHVFQGVCAIDTLNTHVLMQWVALKKYASLWW